VGVRNTVTEVDPAARIGYDVDMTKASTAIPEQLGLPLPGVMWLPYWRVTIEKRGNSDVLAWKVADSPQAPAAAAMTLVSVPRPVSSVTIKRGRERLQQRLKSSSPVAPRDVDELLAVFHDMGSQIELRRQIPAGDPPFFGGSGALDDFVTLSDQEPEAIRAFAAHWGPLGICKHYCPWTHSLARRSPTSLTPICSPLGVALSQGRSGWEQLKHWRDYSRQAKDITLEAVALKNDRSRRPSQLQSIFGRVATWLEIAAVPLLAYADIGNQRPWPYGFGISFAITGVFQIVALQLLGVVAGGRELAQCSHCGFPFALTGHREGRRRFCPTCVEKKIPMRYAARDYRARFSSRG
jgi:hypothetical protein